MPAVKTLTPQVRVRLVDLAAQLLEEKGVAALTLRQLATRAGTSTMAVYTLFGDKQGLLAAVYEQGFARLGAALEAELQGRADPLDALAALGRAYRAAALASPRVYALMFSNAGPEFQPGPQAQAVADATFGPLVRAVARCQTAGALRGDDAERTALHLWAVAHGMVSIELTDPPSRVAADLDLAYEESLVFAIWPFITAD